MSKASHALDESAVEPVDDASDPYEYGWRYARESAADGSEKLARIPLTYQDLLDPEVGDFIAEDTVHRQVIDEVFDVLKRRYRDQPEVAVWGDLKIAFVIPGLTTGPGPDICVVDGVEDRDRRRKSFRFGEEPGTIRLVIEVVSERSHAKDTHDLLEVYARLGVEEYVAVLPTGLYPSGPFELRGWRLGSAGRWLRRLRADADGRLHLRATGILFGTGEDGFGLRLWDASTGERLRTSAELAVAEAEARREEMEARRDAERRAETEAVLRRETEAENERLRARLRELRGGD